MNKSETELHRAIRDYAREMQNYGQKLDSLVRIIDELDLITAKLDELNLILEKDRKIRPLGFVKQIESLPEINKSILDKLKERFKS